MNAKNSGWIASELNSGQIIEEAVDDAEAVERELMSSPRYGIEWTEAEVRDGIGRVVLRGSVGKYDRFRVVERDGDRVRITGYETRHDAELAVGMSPSGWIVRIVDVYAAETAQEGS